MAGRLQYFVTVEDPKTGERKAFGPEDEIPDWAAELITNPSAWAEAPEHGDGDDEGDDPYKGWVKAQLAEEIEKRNAAREDEDDHIVAGGKGTVADLKAALVADDA